MSQSLNLQDLADRLDGGTVADARGRRYGAREERGRISTDEIELYGTEDGNVPATFQIIFMVSPIRVTAISMARPFPSAFGKEQN